MGYPVNWFQIQGGDAPALRAFYKKVFGWKMAPAPEGGSMMMVAPEKGGIAGGIGASMDGNKNVSVYVSVPNLKKHLAKIQGAGGQRAMDPFELPAGMGHIAGFIDPAGNWIGLWEPGAGNGAGTLSTGVKRRPPRKAPAKRGVTAKTVKTVKPLKLKKAKRGTRT